VIPLAAISALDEALWDLTGKHLGVPAYALLGGKARDRIRLYANGWCRTGGPLTEYAAEAERVARDGFTALKFDPFVNVSAEHRAVPLKIMERREIEVAARRIAAVRDAVGPEVDILLEAHGWFDVNTAIEIGQRMEEYDCLVYEEPIEPTNPQAMAQVAAAVAIPVASGERIYTRWGFLPFLEAGALRVQPDIEYRRHDRDAQDRRARRHLPPGDRAAQLLGADRHRGGRAGRRRYDNLLIQEWFLHETDEHYAIVDCAYEREARDAT
jgi:galactonate dehydratase